MATQRLSSMMLSRSVLDSVTDAAQRLSETQRKLASGKEINRPSDDPFGTNRALLLRADLEQTRQHQRNIDEGGGWLSATDSALSTLGDLTHRVRELLLQGSSDSTSPDARAAIAAEVDQIAEAVKQEGNTTYAGRFIFSGTATQTKPYGPSGAGGDAYAGDAGAIAREIGPGVSVQVNVLASDLIGSGQAAGDNKLLNVLRDVSAHLRGGTVADADALRTGDLQRLDANVTELLRVRAQVGATTNRLETADGRLSELEESTTKLLSETEDTDMAKAMVDFSTQQSVYQSALRSGANIVQASLLDFLR